MSSYRLEAIVTSIFMVVVSVVAVFGNLMVIVAILWNKRLRTVPYNFLFLNLAVADMLQGAIAMPLRLADQLNQADKKPLIPCLVVISKIARKGLQFLAHAFIPCVVKLVYEIKMKCHTVQSHDVFEEN